VKDDIVRRVALQNSTKKRIRHSKRAKSTSSVDSLSESSSSEIEDASPAASALLSFFLFSFSFSCLNLAEMCVLSYNQMITRLLPMKFKDTFHQLVQH
jgi:hypothetical protein